MEKLFNFADVLLTPRKSIVNSRSECNIEATLGSFTFASPICPSNMKSILTYDLCKLFDSKNWFYVYHRIDGRKDVFNFVLRAMRDKFRVISISIGIQDKWLRLIAELADCVKNGNWRVDFITIDVAHSHTDRVAQFVKIIKQQLPNTYLIVGNGCTGEWIEFLEDLGVDCAKVGIGVSDSCRTRQYTGFGSATASSLIECKEAAFDIKILSDGGITVKNDESWIGDAAKAITLGADFVMSGSLFSRCLDSPAIVNGYYGNASARVKNDLHHIEGTTVNVQTNGLTTEKMMNLISDSLRSSVSYAGGNKLMDLRSVEWRLVK